VLYAAALKVANRLAIREQKRAQTSTALSWITSSVVAILLSFLLFYRSFVPCDSNVTPIQLPAMQQNWRPFKTGCLNIFRF